ncbi:uncharacterized protein EV154DRAFT_556602 [Mucor mucedo]|uniref:uncharacterized protein n=1 Tax=Mucor mucedo TaxID=29922 RepID=UPI00221F3755|nr:uncharacterized protein EV154DRAFT_556602 [Mucor mucedo]KAI7871123.1 hypothetical protein EV154DRAFT_556602 [Mucor mucedo]
MQHKYLSYDTNYGHETQLILIDSGSVIKAYVKTPKFWIMDYEVKLQWVAYVDYSAIVFTLSYRVLCIDTVKIINGWLTQVTVKFESDNSELRKNTLITDGLMTVMGRFIQIIFGCNDPI